MGQKPEVGGQMGNFGDDPLGYGGQAYSRKTRYIRYMVDCQAFKPLHDPLQSSDNPLHR
jgi:hypothetical protein